MSESKADTLLGPVGIARITLRNLRERGLLPTPENYVREYCIVGGLPLAAGNARATDGPDPDTTRQIENIIAHLGETSAGLATGVDRFHSDTTPLLADIGINLSKEGFARLLQEFTRSTSYLQQSVNTSRTELMEIRRKLDRTNDELKRAKELARTDPLTGLANRRALGEIIVRDIARARRTNDGYSVAILDIDHFKRVNDKHGHAAGDQALVHVATLAKSGVRDTDAVYRYGGEEFVILLPGSRADGAHFVVDRMRVMVEKTPYVFAGEKIKLRFSAGVAELQAGEDAEHVLGRADHALFEAKRAGRNRVNLAVVSPEKIISLGEAI